jgi:hypothetical protein
MERRHHKDHESTNAINAPDHDHTKLRAKNDLQLSGIGSYDVLCGRHKLAFNNIGNRRLRVTVSLSLERYLANTSRQDKTLVIISIVKLLQETGGRFLKWKKDRWIELGEKQAREKVGHAFRDMASARDLLPSSYASTLSAKKDISLQSSTHLTSKEKQCNNMPAVALTSCRSNKSESDTFNENDSAVESSAHFGCDVHFPATSESCFELDIWDDSLFKSLFEGELDSLDESNFGSPAAEKA